MKLLVPLDGSSLGEIVYPWVRLLGSQAELLRSYLPSEELHLGHGLPINIAKLVNDEGLDVEINAYLKRQAEKLAPMKVVTSCSIGHPADTILDHAGPHDAIVMASHGSQGITRWLLGGVTTKVVRASAKPVLVVSARPEQKVRSAKLERIFVPLDGSEVAEIALKQAADLARAHKSKIIVYQGILNRSDSSDIAQTEVLAAKEYLGKAAEKLAGIDVEMAVHESGHRPEIVERADHHDADMIVMGSHGRSGVSRWVLGSVAERVVQHSNCPVFVVYARE